MIWNEVGIQLIFFICNSNSHSFFPTVNYDDVFSDIYIIFVYVCVSSGYFLIVVFLLKAQFISIFSYCLNVNSIEKAYSKFTVVLPVWIINLPGIWFSAMSVLCVTSPYLHLEYRLQNYKIKKCFRDHLIFYFIHTKPIFPFDNSFKISNFYSS